MLGFFCVAGVPMGYLNLWVWLGFQWDAWIFLCGWGSNGMLEFMCVWLGFQWDA